MKAIQIAKYGGPEELQLREVAQPEPGAGEALVRVQAAGVNYADIYFRNGTLPRPIPFTLGIEGAGEIEAVGDVMADACFRLAPIARERSRILERTGAAPGRYLVATIHREANVEPATMHNVIGRNASPAFSGE